jgi:diacylglycerol kinase (ATP)
MRVILIHNPEAGTDRQPSRDRLLAAIRRAGHRPVYQSAKARRWEASLGKPADIIAVAGGDGTVGKVTRVLRGRNVPVTILPTGTANNVAKTLGLTDRSIEELIEGWKGAAHFKFDMGMASGPWGSTAFTEGLGLGFFTDSMHRLYTTDKTDLPPSDHADEKKVSVLKLLKQQLQSCPARRMKIVLDGKNVSGEYILLEAMNIKYLGPNLCLAPCADPSDGLLDVALVSKADQGELSSYLSDCIEGTPSQPKFMVRRGQYLQIETKGLVIHIDDETWPSQSMSFPGSSMVVNVKANSYTLEFLVPS